MVSADRSRSEFLFCPCAKQIHSGTLGADMTNLEVRVLVVLWATDKGSIGRSALSKRFGGKTIRSPSPPVTIASNVWDKLENPERAYTLLIELSSPLVGYLGRNEGKDWAADRFYFLRDLTV